MVNKIVYVYNWQKVGESLVISQRNILADSRVSFRSQSGGITLQVEISIMSLGDLFL